MRLKETKEIQLLEAMYDPGFGVLFCWFWEVDFSFFFPIKTILRQPAKSE